MKGVKVFTGNGWEKDEDEINLFLEEKIKINKKNNNIIK